MQAEKKLTVGIIGNGKSANRYHIPFLLTRKETIKLKTIYARSLQKKDWAHLPEVCYTNQIQTVLDDPEIDLVNNNTGDCACGTGGRGAAQAKALSG